MPSIPYDMGGQHPFNHDHVAPHDMALHSTAEHHAPEYNATTYPAPMGSAPVYTAVIDQFAADSSVLPYNASMSYSATVYQVPTHTLEMPGGMRGQYPLNHDVFPEGPHASGYIALPYGAPLDTTWMFDIPGATQDVGQVAPDNGGQMFSTSEPVCDAPAYTRPTYQTSMDTGQTYQGPMGTMAMPNAPGGAHGMDQPGLESITRPLRTGQLGPSASSLQEWAPVEPSSGPVHQRRRQQRRDTGSKAKGKGKVRQGHLSPAGPSPASSSDSGYGTALAHFYQVSSGKLMITLTDTASP
ncbi:hypothetical protein CERSUDRAFT_98416 [Gelatoporia subvermispora B]|uniref:Uncharacterized protein n=1 Tax=Ceriporiopsis subvermispora (strain B) TaxID=914234 RepID=M2QMA4_CERS8|nr:hypothetical protein CERSUDRAFT_98416 [Gelatoporia subvermispora B]